MLSQQQIEAIILYHLYGESEAAAKRFREAVTNAAKEIAAQQSVQWTANGACENCGNNCWKLVCETCGAE